MNPINTSFPASRLRRLRQNVQIRNLISESTLQVSDLIWPLFVCEGKNVKEKISTMDGVFRLSIDNLIIEAKEAISLGINCIALFPSIEPKLKTLDCIEAYNPNNLINTATKAVKDACPELLIMLDVALDPYNISGHDGLFKNNEVLNDETVEILKLQALVQAEAGADILGPSDMMDGRIKSIRSALEREGYDNKMIMAYSAKYASTLYTPFRQALGGASNFKCDKKTYQMDPGNTDEALRNVSRDIQEGADMVIVKPGAPYLDVCYRIKKTFGIPTFSYQVSGEYSMIMTSIQNGWLEQDEAILESLICFKRAGCDGILTYFAPMAAKALLK
ncbi:porphobilinogen synthase [Paracoccaceae bacterium]|nr:porphobilinogen synthase [Paracoccaceae bacterium]